MPSPNTAGLCLEDVKTKLSTVKGIKEKIFHVYSEYDLENATKSMKKPCVGLMYEGLRSVPDTSGKGLSTQLGIAVVAVTESKEGMWGIDRKDELIQLLDDMREALKLTKAPTGHDWQFVMEVPSQPLGNFIVYIQRWQTTAILSAIA